MDDRNMEMARRVAAAVAREGGRTYYVGGFVRDRLLGRENKDIDIEVHGIPVHALESILDSLGERLTMGAGFGIMGLRHYELDIAMPRSETATGRGHKDFAVFVDPFLGAEKAARRRDFTMNALMEDVLTGEVLDFFGGQEDMRRGRIRHVDDISYAEDPLRALRACQFAARFGFAVAEETIALSYAMDLKALPGERIMGELEKALLKAERPSIFFEELRKMRQLSVWFPELEALIGLGQNLRFHPEGDVWIHTMQVLDEAATIDGASSLQVYLHVILPSIVPVMIVVGLFSFNGAWNDFLWPSIVMTDVKNQTITAGLRLLSGQYEQKWAHMIASCLVSMLPPFVLYMVAQKYFLAGISVQAGVKG